MIAELAPGFTIRKCKTGCLLLAIETRQTPVATASPPGGSTGAPTARKNTLTACAAQT